MLRFCATALLRHVPEALLQLATAVAMLRENAEKWHIDTEKIVIQGSSAGGHLAASLGVFWNKPFVAEALGMDSEKFRPNGLCSAIR